MRDLKEVTFVYSIKCKVCGKEFQARNPKYCYCSEKCRTDGLRQVCREHTYRWNQSDRCKEVRKSYYLRTRTLVDKFCAVCGVKLPDGRQTYCLECLLKDYRDTHSQISIRRLYSRGFDIQMINEAVKNMEQGVDIDGNSDVR